MSTKKAQKTNTVPSFNTSDASLSKVQCRTLDQP